MSHNSVNSVPHKKSRDNLKLENIEEEQKNEMLLKSNSSAVIPSPKLSANEEERLHGNKDERVEEKGALNVALQ